MTKLLWNTWNETLSGMLSVLYPKVCLHCKHRVFSESIPLCTSCRQELERASQADIRHRLSRLPSADGLFTHCFCLWTFDAGTILQSLQHAIKYQNLPSCGRSVGKLVGEGYMQTFSEKPDYVVPIPLHPKRELSRGYNQSLELAAGIADVLERPINTDLRRRKSTISQTKLSRAKRWENVCEAFSLTRPSRLGSSHVLLVDDVLTTGSTLAAAAQVVAPCAKRISLATLGLARA